MKYLPWPSQGAASLGWVVSCLHWRPGGLLPQETRVGRGTPCWRFRKLYTLWFCYISGFYFLFNLHFYSQQILCLLLKSTYLTQSPLLPLCLRVSHSSSLALPLSSTSLYLYLIANAGSIAAAIDLCVETPSRQEKWRPAQSHFLRGCKSGRKWLLFHRHCRY